MGKEYSRYRIHPPVKTGGLLRGGMIKNDMACRLLRDNAFHRDWNGSSCGLTVFNLDYY